MRGPYQEPMDYSVDQFQHVHSVAHAFGVARLTWLLEQPSSSAKIRHPPTSNRAYSL